MILQNLINLEKSDFLVERTIDESVSKYLDSASPSVWDT